MDTPETPGGFYLSEKGNAQKPVPGNSFREPLTQINLIFVGTRTARTKS